MTPTQQIHINELLIHREEVFARIYALERKIEALAGCAYPFELPELPSHAKRKKSRAKKKVSKAVKVRTLEGDEVAYRVTYEQDGQTVTEMHQHAQTLDLLLNMKASTVVVKRIEALNANGEVVALLFEKS